MVPKILNDESEMGRKEMLLFGKTEELDYLNIVVTSHEIVSQCNSEIKYQRLLRLTEACMSKSKVDQFSQDEGSGPSQICNLFLHIYELSILFSECGILIERDQICGWVT
jgi:hypothetical protein